MVGTPATSREARSCRSGGGIFSDTSSRKNDTPRTGITARQRSRIEARVRDVRNPEVALSSIRSHRFRARTGEHSYGDDVHGVRTIHRIIERPSTNASAASRRRLHRATGRAFAPPPANGNEAGARISLAYADNAAAFNSSVA